jgi:hypothetical protein
MALISNRGKEECQFIHTGIFSFDIWFCHQFAISIYIYQSIGILSYDILFGHILTIPFVCIAHTYFSMIPKSRESCCYTSNRNRHDAKIDLWLIMCFYFTFLSNIWMGHR